MSNEQNPQPEFVNNDDLKAEALKELIETIQDLPTSTRIKLLSKAMPGVFNSTNTYFHEKYALQILPDIDLLYEDLEKKELSLFYPYEQYPQWKKKTVYNYVNEAFRFIVKQLDTKDKKYEKLRDIVDVSPGRDGIYIKWKKRFSKEAYQMRAVLVKASEVDAVEGEPDLSLLEDDPPQDAYKLFKDKLIQFMEATTDTTAKFEQADLKLSPEHIAELEQMFEQSAVFGGIVNTDKKTKLSTVMCRRID